LPRAAAAFVALAGPLDLLVRRDRARRNAPHPGKWVKIIRWGDAAEAKALIIEGVTRARDAKK